MRKVLKWIGIGLGSLIVLLLIAGFTMYLIGGSKLNQTYAVHTADLVIPTDSASLVRGAHLARINGCTDCHGPDLSGQVFVDAPPFRVVAANLTAGAGGIGRTYTAEDWDRTIRHGVKPDGKPVFIMPSAAFHRLSDEDTAALIAYLQQVPAVDHDLPPTEIRTPGRLMAAGPLDVAMEVRTEPARSSRPPIGPTADYGEYLASGVCAYCHGEGLLGAQPATPGSPPAPSLVAAGQWSLDEFTTTLRTGTTPGGRTLDPEFMPVAFTSQYDSTEYRALHAYLETLQGGIQTASDS
ncbi:MAG: cytochrome c [Rhodothermaceae bacterium]|nr:cytochrome c [Rhodothermaceae bacterium]